MAIELIRRADVPVVDPTVYGMRGYATLYNVAIKQWWTTVLDPGAFAAAIERNGPRTAVTWSHSYGEPQIGETRVLRDDPTGVWFEAAMAPTADAARALGVVALREKCACSISFNPGERVDDDDGVEHIMSVSELTELGPCLNGACPGAWVEVFLLAEAAWAGDLPFAPAAPARTPDELSAALAAAVDSTRSLNA